MMLSLLLNCDGVSVNMGAYSHLGALIKENALWLALVHCLNHRIKLALQDAFENSVFFRIENLLMKLYYLYQNNPKCYRQLKNLAKNANRQSQNHRKLMECNGLIINIAPWNEL